MKAKIDFDYWVKNFDHHEETRLEKLLLTWFSSDSAAKLITNYEEFAELVIMLNNSGEYEISEIPSLLEFEKKLRMY